LLPEFIRSRLDLLLVRFWHYDCSRLEHGSAFQGTWGLSAGPCQTSLETARRIQVHMEPLVPGRLAHKTQAMRALYRMAFAGTVPLLASSRPRNLAASPPRGTDEISAQQP
jgi:hypothetical protein